ncbi:sodium:proton antiporter [Piscinibacter sakaiensis]|uniref:sodium:proton antiporter n=1 Tax=Piscinibacter sakaiensis TaxID=1547922 RepID=UPI003AAE77EB
MPLLLLLAPTLAQAADFDGSKLAAWWGIPFAGVLLSIAILPLVSPHFWHHHYGKIVAAWALVFFVPFAAMFGIGVALDGFLHALVAEYIPFILLVGSLYVIAGGIFLRGNLHGSPALNTGILAVGSVLASIMGTTGASMLLIRPLIRANDNRKSTAHVVVFFVFTVSNVGGSLTPLGDPPLFLGFLKGVDFFWTMQHIFPETLFIVGSLLVIFYFLDSWHYRKEGVTRVDPTPDSPTIGFEGKINFLLLAGVVGLVLLSGLWNSGIAFSVAGADVTWASLVRDIGLLVLAIVSMQFAPMAPREQNQFNWAPIAEVAKLFAAIFLTIIPVIAMLRAGVDGPFGAIVSAVTGSDGQPIPAMYFWATGVLSSFLDNAPTYLVFFNTAGGEAQALMTTYASTLAAISAGAVFMGANTYIGNAPNLMVKAIAEDRGVKMPSFFGYMGWSVLFLVPLFIVMTWIWF